MDKIFLSVIIPVYNTEKYLEKCIDSVLNARSNVDDIVEIVVINDGSKGNCDEIIQKYRNLDNFVYIKQDNSGRGATRNVGICASHGEYITFVDSDDFIDSNMYKDMLKKIKEKNSDIVICDIESVDEEENKLLLIPGKNEKITDDKLGCFDVMMMPSCVNKIFRRSLFDGVLFPVNINYEDLATIPLIMLKAGVVSYIPNVYYYYVQNSNSIMNQDYSVEKLNILEALNIVFGKIDKLGLNEDIVNKAKYSLFTRRYYEEVLEKIMLSKQNKAELVFNFVKIGKKIVTDMSLNPYLLKEIESNGLFKKIGNRLLFKYIEQGKLNKINNILTLKKYYRCVAIIYASKSICDN